jgi:hypothetical protein
MGQQELDQAKFKRAVKTAKWPEYDPEEDWTPEEWAKLETEFRYFEGPVRNPDHFALIVVFNKNDDLSTWIEYDSGEVSVNLFTDDDIRDNRDLLPVFDPVEPLKAQSRIGPNKPCICGSGKKYKKCCGR